VGDADAAKAPADTGAAWIVDTVHMAAVIASVTTTSRPLDLVKNLFIDPPTGYPIRM
jgi:hypothetical protein